MPCPPPGNLPDPGIKPASLTSPALAGQFFTTRATEEALLNTGVGQYLSSSPAWSPLLGCTELTNTTGAASSPPNLSQPTSLRPPYVPHRPQLHRDSPQNPDSSSQPEARKEGCEWNISQLWRSKVPTLHGIVYFRNPTFLLLKN